MDVPCPSPITPNVIVQGLPFLNEPAQGEPERRTEVNGQFTNLYSLLRVVNTEYQYDLRFL